MMSSRMEGFQMFKGLPLRRRLGSSGCFGSHVRWAELTVDVKTYTEQKDFSKIETYRLLNITVWKTISTHFSSKWTLKYRTPQYFIHCPNHGRIYWGVRGINPPRISLTPLIKCSTPPKFRETPLEIFPPLILTTPFKPHYTFFHPSLSTLCMSQFQE
jgi:hypothetical protein